MRLVYICQWNPWRLNSGGIIRNAWLLRALAERYPVDLVTCDDPSSDVPADFAQACASISRFPVTNGVPGAMRRAVQALRPKASVFTSGVTPAALCKKVGALMQRKGAIAVTEMKMVGALGGAAYPFIYACHNAEYELFRRRAAYERQPARSLLFLESERVRRIETRMVCEAKLVTACSENDRRELLDLVPHSGSKILVVPNGVDMERYAAIAGARGDRRTILITGSFDWRPNVIGLEWFIDKVLPCLREHLADEHYAVRVAGRMDADLAARLNRIPHVSAVPNPADMREELARARIVAAPVLPSSGTRLRILEAWAAGRPVVTTAAGALGIACRDGDDLLMADAAPQFAAAICKLLDDAALWERIHNTALRSVVRYDWRKIACGFLEQASPIIEQSLRN